jgi:nicotinate-nucleotide pyrophosphorylase (carboxylating)
LSAPLTDSEVARLIEAALAEDIGSGDISGDAVAGADQRSLARIKAKAKGMVAGIRVAEAVFAAVDAGIDFEPDLMDGAKVEPGDHVAVIGGQARALLAAERTALNFLQHLSGIATATRALVDAVAGTGVVILDTRKTTPGMRALEKYAVAVGGGQNHRHGLYDAFLLKDNHVALAGGVTRAIEMARNHRPGLTIEVEVRLMRDVEAALAAGADSILLDNFSPTDAAEAVRLVGGRAKVEISGGVTPDNIRAYASAHPDYISVGWITHSAPALDLSMKLV